MNAKRWLTLDRLLHIDGLVALTVGIFLLAVGEPFSGLLGLPVWLPTLQGILNLCYASYSLPLARRRHRPRWMLWILVAGNLAYAVFAAVLLHHFYPVCTVLGVVFFLSEVVFIGGLGVLEWGYVKQ